MKRIIRDRRLSPEEAAKYKAIRERVGEELPDLIARHHERMATWMRACFKRDYAGLLSLMDEFHEADRMSQQSLLHYTLTMMREALLTLSGADALLRSRDAEQKFIQDFSKVMSVNKIEQSNQLITEAGYHLERNGSAKMIFLDLSLRLSRVMVGG